MKKSLIIIILVILLINPVSAFCPYDDAGNVVSKSLNKKIASNMDGAGKLIQEKVFTPGTEFAGFGSISGRNINPKRQGVLKSRAGSKSDHLLLSDMQRNRIGNFYDYTVKFKPDGYVDIFISAPPMLVKEGVLSDKAFLSEFVDTILKNHGITGFENKKRVFIGGKTIIIK